MFLYFLCFGGQSKHVFKSTEHENMFLCLKGNYQFITEVFLPYPPSARPHLLVQLCKHNGKCKGKTVFVCACMLCCFFFFSQVCQRSRKSRCKKDWKITKGFLFSSDKQSIELSKLHNPIFDVSIECFIIRKCDSSLEKQQAKPKCSGGKKALEEIYSHSNERKQPLD